MFKRRTNYSVVPNDIAWLVFENLKRNFEMMESLELHKESQIYVEIVLLVSSLNNLHDDRVNWIRAHENVEEVLLFCNYISKKKNNLII